MYNNELTGEIPQEIENFVNLNYLDLQGNNLSGLINDFICGIDTYNLINNSFCGPFPDCLDNNSIFPQENSYDCEEFCDENTEVNVWGSCYNIDETIELIFNNSGLTGQIPSEIGNLINLERLYLNGNQFSGEIPSDFGNLINLERLYLNGNQLSGEIPLEIGNLINLKRLYLTGNQLSGQIPFEIGNLINLEKLYLNENQFSGEIPLEIGNLINLTNLYLSDNELSGQIPSEICNQGDSSPDLDNNQFCPPYPECIEDYVGEQDTSECIECTLGDINGDTSLNILDLVQISNLILENGYNECGDTNSDGELNILDLVTLVNIILDN